MIALIPIMKLADFSASKTLFEPYDYLRRGCGVNQVYDPLATDYSSILTSTTQFQSFCQLIKDQNPDANITTDCQQLNSDNENLPSYSKLFFREIRPLYNNQSQYSYGYNIDDSVVCLDKEIDREDAKYLCTSEFITYFNNVTSQSQPQNQIFSEAEMQQMIEDLDDDYKYLQNFCVYIPDNGQFMKQELQESMNINYYVFIQDTSGDSLSDKISYIGEKLGGIFVEQVRSQWDTILYGFLVSIGITIIYFLLLRFLVSAIIWVTIIALFAVCIYGSVTLLLTGANLADQLDYQKTYFGQVDDDLNSKKQLYEGFGWTCIALSIIILLLTLCCFNQIRIATGVIKQTMSAVSSVPGIFFSPLLGLISCIIWLAFALVFGYTLYIKGTFDSKSNRFNFTYMEYDQDNNLVESYDPKLCVSFTFWVYGSIWGIFFIYGLNEYFISAVITSWYFNLEKSKSSLKGTFSRSVKFTVKQIGTIFVTSFITSFVIFIRVILEFVLKRLEQSNKISENKAVKATLCLTRCVLKFLQKLVQWFNRNIQIYSAISGENYCKSMKLSVKLLMSRIFSNLFAKGLTNFFIFLGQMLVVIGGTVVCVFITYLRTSEIYWGTMLLSLLIGFILSFYIFEILEISIDTIYFSFLYEETYLLREREQNGIIYAPGDLKNLLK